MLAQSNKCSEWPKVDRTHYNESGLAITEKVQFRLGVILLGWVWQSWSSICAIKRISPRFTSPILNNSSRFLYVRAIEWMKEFLACLGGSVGNSR